MWESGRKDVLIRLLQTFHESQRALRTPTHQKAYWFCTVFLVSVISELHNAQSGDALNEDILKVWMDLGCFGIERDAIEDYLTQTGEREIENL
jgi:hypothetical protein